MQLVPLVFYWVLWRRIDSRCEKKSNIWRWTKVLTQASAKRVCRDLHSKTELYQSGWTQVWTDHNWSDTCEAVPYPILEKKYV